MWGSEHRSRMAAEVDEHTVAQPLADRMLRPQVFDLGPAVLRVARLTCPLNRRSNLVTVNSQHVAPIGRPGLARNLAQPHVQIRWRRQSYRSRLVGVHPLGDSPVAPKLFQGSLREPVFVAEERGRLGD